MREFVIAMLSLALFCLPMPLKAEIYQWTDQDGKVHFGDRPPLSSQAKDISDDLEKINVSKEYSSPDLMLKHAQEKDRARQEAYREQEELRAKSPSKEQVCKQMRKDHKIINGRVVFLDQDGKDMGITETERKKRAADLLEQINRHCQ